MSDSMRKKCMRRPIWWFSLTWVLMALHPEGRLFAQAERERERECDSYVPCWPLSPSPDSDFHLTHFLLCPHSSRINTHTCSFVASLWALSLPSSFISYAWLYEIIHCNDGIFFLARVMSSIHHLTNFFQTAVFPGLRPHILLLLINFFCIC